MRRQAIIGVLALPVLAIALAACGGGSNESNSATTPSTSTQSTTTAPAGSGGTVLQLQADPSGALTFDKTTLEAPAGKVTIEMTNPSPVAHDIAIEGNGVDVTGKVVSDGGTSTVSADLQAGTYEFYCTVDGHEDAGMKGTLTVQ